MNILYDCFIEQNDIDSKAIVCESESFIASDIKLVMYYHLNFPMMHLEIRSLGFTDALNLVSNPVTNFLAILKTELK